MSLLLESNKEIPDSPCSSDDKNDWKTNEQEYSKRWPRGHTSSSSRDLSPWDDDAPGDYRRRIHPDRHGFYMRHARRMHSGDDDYDFEEEMAKRHERRSAKGAMSRSRENFGSCESQNWYHPSNHHSWSPPEEDETGDPRVLSRQFERSSYERSTYGPPYEKRETTSLSPYERKDFKYDKRKFYRDYPRTAAGYEYDYDDYDQRAKSRREYDMFEQGYNRDPRTHNLGKDYFYDREKRSFDRESNDSFESAGRRRKSFGSGDMYGSLDSREGYRESYSASMEKVRLNRKAPVKPQRSNDEFDQDSDGEMVSLPPTRRRPGDTRSLQRPSSSSRPRKSSGSSPWDGEGMNAIRILCKKYTFLNPFYFKQI